MQRRSGGSESRSFPAPGRGKGGRESPARALWGLGGPELASSFLQPFPRAAHQPLGQEGGSKDPQP